MKVKDIKQQRVTFIPSAKNYKGQKIVTIDEILHQICPAWAKRIEALRAIRREQGYEAYRDKKVYYPVWFPCGTFPYGDCHDNKILTYTNLIVLDIDVKKGENEDVDIDQIRKSLFDYPWTVAVLKSIGGTGIFALVLIEDHTKIKEYFKYFKAFLKRKYGVKLDMTATNPGRKRFISYDRDMYQWIKPEDAEITPWNLYACDEPVAQKTSILNEVRRNPERLSLFNDDDKLNDTKKAMDLLINKYRFSIDNYNGDRESKYHTWWHVGNDIKAIFGDTGEELFVTFSKNSSSYSDDDSAIRKVFENCDASQAHSDEDIHKHWQGMAKRIVGLNWKSK